MTTVNRPYHTVLSSAQNTDVLSGMYSFFNFPKNESDIERAKLLWLIRLRWAAIALFFIMSGPAYITGVLNRTSLVIFIGVIGFLFVFNLLTHLIFINSKKNIGSVFICFQLASDLTVLAALLAISGGFANPCVALFLLNAALGGILIKGHLTWPFILLCHALLVALQIGFVLDTPDISQKSIWILVAISHILLISTWLVMRSLGSYLETHFEKQTLTRIQFEKQDRLRALGALAAGFSHEFASPLNAAKLRIDRLERILNKPEVDSSLIEQAKQNLHEAKTSIRNCEMVIHSMNASQLDVRDYKVKPIHLVEFINDVIDSWKEENPLARIQIQTSVSDVQQVRASAINLAQVILNLLDNAFEANAKGLIQLSIQKNNSSVEISVDDEGPGFSEPVLSRRGEPFMTTKEHGTGLGLYVSEIFVQSLGGSLNIHNKSPNAGATVTLSWPLNYEENLS